MKCITYRYMWLCEDCENLNVRIITDLDEGHAKFIEQVKQNVQGLSHFTRVYVCEYDVEKLEVYEPLMVDVDESEVQS